MQPLFLVLPAVWQAVPGVTLEAALAEARAANARLPVAAMDVKATEEQARTARGQLLPRLGVLSDLQLASPNFGYSSGGSPVGEERLQLVAAESLYSGGALQAGVAGAEAQVRASKAPYRVAEKALDPAVPTP